MRIYFDYAGLSTTRMELIADYACKLISLLVYIIVRNYRCNFINGLKSIMCKKELERHLVVDLRKSHYLI